MNEFYGPTPAEGAAVQMAYTLKEYHTIRYTPSSAVAAGDVVVVNSIVYVAVHAIDANVEGVLTYLEAFTVQKDTSIFAAGDEVNWNTVGSSIGGTAGVGCATSTSANGTTILPMGRCVYAAGTTDPYVGLTLNSFFLTVLTTVGGALTGVVSVAASASTLPVTGLQAAQGGSITTTGGTSTTSANAGGVVALVGGTPGVTGAGGAVTATGGAGGATSGTGGAVTLTGGAGTNGNANGGNVTLVGGAKNGSGAPGAVVIGGPMNVTVGGATTAVVAASGTTAGTLGCLPAATGNIYPVTLGTTNYQVIVNPADNVAGRVIELTGTATLILQVLPPSGGNINGLGANAAYSSAAGKGVRLTCLTAGGSSTWAAVG